MRLLISIMLLLPGFAIAQTVPHTFVDGEPALASEVNENFQAVAQVATSGLTQDRTLVIRESTSSYVQGDSLLDMMNNCKVTDPESTLCSAHRIDMAVRYYDLDVSVESNYGFVSIGSEGTPYTDPYSGSNCVDGLIIYNLRSLFATAGNCNVNNKAYCCKWQ